ncbi:uncharacterized protein LOC112182700 [Rosa chinensis]|uniref:uncharacterized protein LOC112176598 n=1 Tax=Rosa chinensis TaxID=74649 RepID=UPI000D08B0F3|nr:uncharacterized protein LOC112176598 [Rosa chinensis]XP_024170375.1 uncharacterized protein LOC112176598 [Rosa chinensis]XP_024176985.1 uncharacterized protein LOC112182700 [Rosa chinensis]XP_024176986.1 uncharacterized protein LOC112182700 [Rosa chinensis]XP_024176987.1 uncharacterized protein LOC112182700 [Rosa chinensis]XP_040364986.1 uncharacterized protein LOC112182700 [Rosa chinensis]
MSASGQAEEIHGDEGSSYHDGGPWRRLCALPAFWLNYGAIFGMKCSALRLEIKTLNTSGFEQIYLRRKLILGEPLMVCLLLRYFRRTLFAAAKSEVSGVASMARTMTHPLEEFFELVDRKPDKEKAVVYGTCFLFPLFSVIKCIYELGVLDCKLCGEDQLKKFKVQSRG